MLPIKKHKQTMALYLNAERNDRLIVPKRQITDQRIYETYCGSSPDIHSLHDPLESLIIKKSLLLEPYRPLQMDRLVDAMQ
jgi:hypothetical protein